MNIEGGRYFRELPSPISLPEELAQFLREQGPFACVTQATDRGTSYVIKAPAHEIASVCGRVPIRVVHSLHDHPQAPVIRTVIGIYDQPERPLKLESFINVADPQQAADFAALAGQKEHLLLFYDEQIQHRLSKAVPNPRHTQQIAAAILAKAQRLRAAIPEERYAFEEAKAAVIAATKL